jgi:hypothetical protein
VVLWGQPQTSQLVEVYWFAAYNTDGIPSTFDLTPHPSHGGVFYDDSVPAKEDPIVCYGTMGFDTNGERCCAWEHRGACCLDGGSCVFVNESACGEMEGTFLGVDVLCLPDPCGASGIDLDLDEMAGRLRLILEGPNPVSSRLDCRIDLPESGHVDVAVHDVRGRLVQVLHRGEMPAGERVLAWDVEAVRPRVPNGVYYIRARALGEATSRGFVVLR